MKKIRCLLIIVVLFFEYTGCNGRGIKMKNRYDDENKIKKDILDYVNAQYGINFEIGRDFDDGEPVIVLGKEFEFNGYVRPSSISENEKCYNLYSDYTVFNYTGTFKTQAHVRMFEKQLNDDVNKILNKIGINYDILEFRGMSRNINTWSSKSTYEQYRDSKDFETWIYIKLDKNLSVMDYPKVILPMLKNINSALEPTYNVTVLFYVDEYIRTIYRGKSKEPEKEILKNPTVIFLDLSKYENIQDWTEHDIEIEINIVHEEWFITAWKKANGLE